jgi:hypothetical protein
MAAVPEQEVEERCRTGLPHGHRPVPGGMPSSPSIRVKTPDGSHGATGYRSASRAGYHRLIINSMGA